MKEQMNGVSLDNGCTWQKVDELADEKVDTILMKYVDYLDKDTCEEVAQEFAPCSSREFMKQYVERAGYLVIG